MPLRQNYLLIFRFSEGIPRQNHLKNFGNFSSRAQLPSEIRYPWKNFDFYMTKLTSEDETTSDPFCNTLDEKPEGPAVKYIIVIGAL